MKVPAMKAPHVIDTAGVYDLALATSLLGLSKSCLKGEARNHRLRVARRGGKYYVIGSWLLEWLKKGEVGRHKSDTNGHANGQNANGEPRS